MNTLLCHSLTVETLALPAKLAQLGDNRNHNSLCGCHVDGCTCLNSCVKFEVNQHTVRWNITMQSRS